MMLILCYARHGIPLGIIDKSTFKVSMGRIISLAPPVPQENWRLGNGFLDVEALTVCKWPNKARKLIMLCSSFQ